MKFYVKIATYLLTFVLTIGCATKKVIVSKQILVIEKKIAPASFKLSKAIYLSDNEKKWVDSVYNVLTFDERLGQLFMVSAYSNRDSTHAKAIDKLIIESKVGSTYLPLSDKKYVNELGEMLKPRPVINSDNNETELFVNSSRLFNNSSLLNSDSLILE